MTRPPSISKAELRRHAEDQLSSAAAGKASAVPDGDPMRLLHELQVHQVELEMQNQMLIEAQAEISRNLEQLTELYDLAPIAYFTLDRNGRITKSNALARKLLGSPLLALDYCHLSRFIGLDKLHDYKTFLERIFSSGRLETCHLTLGGVAGLPPVYAFMEGIADEDRQECRLVVTDLTRQRASDEALASLSMRTEELAAAKNAAEAANRAKATFLANMSHEIRTPMSAILGMVHLMRSSGLNTSQAGLLDKMDTAARHLLGIINDVLDLSKIDAEQLTLEEVPFMLDALMADVGTLIAERIHAKNLGFRMNVAPSLRERQMIGDPLHLKQILLNLLSNAVKFTERGEIELSADLEAENDQELTLRFAVRDSGCGIPTEALDRIFMPFEQVDASTTRQYGGTGLGLSISKRLVRLMHGDLGVSSSPGSGSTFFFTIRLRPGNKGVAPDYLTNKISSPDAQELLKTKHRNKRILLVEDDPIIQEVMLAILCEALGLQVDVASDGAQATDLASMQAYNLILMDMQMPVMDGLTATQVIRRLPQHRKTPILAMTANAFVEDRHRCLDAGMNDFMAKPVDPDELFGKLLKWLDTVPTPTY